MRFRSIIVSIAVFLFQNVYWLLKILVLTSQLLLVLEKIYFLLNYYKLKMYNFYELISVCEVFDCIFFVNFKMAFNLVILLPIIDE